MTPQTGGIGSRAERVALGSLHHIRLSHAPNMKCKKLLGRLVVPEGRSLDRFNRVMRESDHASVRALAEECELISDGLRSFVARCVPVVRVSPSDTYYSERICGVLGI